MPLTVGARPSQGHSKIPSPEKKHQVVRKLQLPNALGMLVISGHRTPDLSSACVERDKGVGQGAVGAPQREATPRPPVPEAEHLPWAEHCPASYVVQKLGRVFFFSPEK